MRLLALTYEELVAHGVNAAFARVLTEPKRYHPDLTIMVGKTNWDYFVPSNASEVVPLWDQNADSYVRWKRNGRTEFVRLYHDDPEWRLVAVSEQGVMCELWQSWVEFQDDENDECRRFAEAIGFRHWEEALRLMESDDEQYEEWILRLE
jgi:hypothetical protein